MDLSLDLLLGDLLYKNVNDVRKRWPAEMYLVNNTFLIFASEKYMHVYAPFPILIIFLQTLERKLVNWR